MQTSLARRQRHRRTIHRRPQASGGSKTVRRILIAIPIILVTLAFLAGFVGVVFAVGVYNQYATGLPDPEEILNELDFDQPSIVYDRTGKVELARLGSLRREVIGFDDIPGEMLDATTAIEDQEFWTNPGFDPIGILSAGLDTISGTSTRRLDDHPAARPRPPAPRLGIRGRDVRAQAARDHPVRQAHRGLSR